MNKPDRSAQSREEIEAVLGTGTSAWQGWRGAAIAAALALALFAAWYGWSLYGTGSPTASALYRTDAAALGDITVTVTATGTVEPTNQVDISSELSGIIRSVKVDYNSTVRVGDVLAELDTDKLKASVASARAKLVAAEARVAEAEATLAEKAQELERKLALAERRVATSQDLDAARATHARAQAALASARADVDAARAELQLNETNLDKTCICSPIDGIVLSRNVDPGQVVAASLQAPVLFTIAEDLAKVEIRVDVDEADVGQVKQGQKAEFVVDAYPDRRFDASIKQLRYGSQVVQGVVTYKAILSASNDALLLRPDMTATADIIVQQEAGVLTVSNQAFRFSPQMAETRDDRGFLQMLLPGRPNFRAPSAPEEVGPDRQVWVLRDGAPAPVDVVAGATDGRRTRIVSGDLKPGDQVIVDTMSNSN